MTSESSYFELMIGLGYGTDPMSPSHQDTGWWWFHDGVACAYMVWLWSNGLPKHVIDWWLLHCTASWRLIYSNFIPCSLDLSCLESIRETFWKLLTNGEATMFIWHEPNHVLMSHVGEVYSHANARMLWTPIRTQHGGSISFQQFSNHLWNQIHVKLLYFPQREGWDRRHFSPLSSFYHKLLLLPQQIYNFALQLLQ